MENKYGGMTINERLYVSGLMYEFDQAVEKKEIEDVVRILKAVELGDVSISAILKAKGLD